MLSAPRCLPRPTTAILQSPLSTSPSKSVWSLTRLTSRTASASSASSAAYTGRPVESLPTWSTASDDRISQPSRSGVIPSVASVSRCPSGVAPPWLPIAGKTNGSSPRDWSSETIASRTAGRSSMPRLPAVMPTVLPGSSSSSAAMSSTAPVVAAVTSETVGWSRTQLTRYARGRSDSSTSLVDSSRSRPGNSNFMDTRLNADEVLMFCPSRTRWGPGERFFTPCLTRASMNGHDIVQRARCETDREGRL